MTKVTFYIEYHKYHNKFCKEPDYFEVGCIADASPGYDATIGQFVVPQDDMTDEEIVAYVKKVMAEREWVEIVSITRYETEKREIKW